MLELVWVIDDDPVNNLICEALLISSQFAQRVVCHASAESALAMLVASSTAPDLLFLDVNMPGLSGWDFIDRFKNLNLIHCPRILMLTSSINPSDIQRAHKEPLIENFLSKPLTAAALALL